MINDKANLKLLQNQLVNAIEDGDLINLLVSDFITNFPSERYGV